MKDKWTEWRNILTPWLCKPKLGFKMFTSNYVDWKSFAVTFTEVWYVYRFRV